MILWAAAALGAAVVATAAAPGDTSTYRLLQSGPALGCSQFDFDDSGAVQVNDLLLCLGAFGHPADAEQPAARFAVSGGQQVGVADLLLVLGAYGSTCSPAAGAGGPAAAIDDTTATDECGCTAGEGWSSGAGACAEGSSTSAAEAAACDDPRPPPAAEESCERLSEVGLDCAACLARPPPEPCMQPLSPPPRTAAEDQAAEMAALWGDREPRDLFNETQFLWDEEAGVRTIELEMTSSNWRFLADDPAAEEYTEGTVHLLGGDGRSRLGSWDNVGIRFKGYYGSLRACFAGTWQTSLEAQQKCNKLSFKLKFNYEDHDQRFFGLKKVMLHASLSDTSLMRER
jgi:hypothetical protein